MDWRSLPVLLAVFTGRSVMLLVGMVHPPEIYTAAVGLYLVWLFIRVARALVQYVSRGAKHFAKQFGIWTVQVRDLDSAHVWLAFSDATPHPLRA